MQRDFIDYYKILQVHYDASPEIIQAAYKRLSRIYHPDNYNGGEDIRMTRINEAYRTLNDTAKRQEYHRIWLENMTSRNQFVQPISSFGTRGSGKAHPAHEIMNDFFYSLKQKKWDNAYLCLTEEDKQKNTIEDFSQWKNAVDRCFEMQQYTIQYYKTYYNCRIGDMVYKQVMEFSVTVTDMDRQTLETSSEVLHKYTAYDGISWKVCLGMTSLKQSILKFQLLADRKDNFDPMLLYKSAVSHNDPLTGLLSEKGFYTEAAREEDRTRRYHNPFSLIVFQIQCENMEREASCICNCASIIRASIRSTDLAGRISNNQLVCLLIETTQDGAHQASTKFKNRIEEKQTEPYTVFTGVAEYSNYSSLEEAVFAACSECNMQGNTLHFGQGDIKAHPIY